MDKKREKKISKMLSYVLRHKPENIGITLDKNGWVDIDILLDKLHFDTPVVFDELKYVVDNNEKNRFAISNDNLRVRANQGHSIEVDLGLKEVMPPAILYHGTSVNSVNSIMKSGINKGNRHHVHLSFDEATANSVGSRKGKCEVLEVQAMRMRADGYKIYISDNGVYLTDEVPSKYISRQNG